MSEQFKKQNNVKPGIDFLFSILIYKPRTIHQGQRHSAEKLRFAYEIEALGTNFLSQIVDAIECISDSAVIKEVENTAVDLTQFQNAKVRSRSIIPVLLSYLFILPTSVPFFIFLCSSFQNSLRFSFLI